MNSPTEVVAILGGGKIGEALPSWPRDLGAGVMGETLLSGLLRRRPTSSVSEKHAERAA